MKVVEMQIVKKTVYCVGALSFDSPDKAKQYIADQIGNMIDNSLSDRGCVIGPKAAIVLNEIMLTNAASLSILLRAYSVGIGNE